LWLRSGLDCWRRGGEIELREAGAAGDGGAAFAAHGDENSLCAGGGDAGGTGIEKASHSADGNGGTGGGVGIEEIDTLRAEIGDDELRSVRS